MATHGRNGKRHESSLFLKAAWRGEEWEWERMGGDEKGKRQEKRGRTKRRGDKGRERGG